MLPFFRFQMAARRGSTLIEMISVLLLIAILSGVSMLYFRDAVPVAQDKQAIAVANTLNGAKRAYMMRISNAATNWSAATTQEQRWNLIRDRIPFAESQTLAQFVPTGYTFDLGSTLSARVSITGPNGGVTY